MDKMDATDPKQAINIYVKEWVTRYRRFPLRGLRKSSLPDHTYPPYAEDFSFITLPIHPIHIYKKYLFSINSLYITAHAKKGWMKYERLFLMDQSFQELNLLFGCQFG